MAQVVDFAREYRRRRSPVLHWHGRRYRIVRPALARLVVWWRQRIRPQSLRFSAPHQAIGK
jgi:hypothetical protein